MRRSVVLVAGALACLIGCTGDDGGEGPGPVDTETVSLPESSETGTAPIDTDPTSTIEAAPPPSSPPASDPISGETVPTGGPVGADGAPIPGNDAGSTGPLGGAGPEAARIESVLPDLPAGYYQLDGADALPWIRHVGRLAQFGTGFNVGTKLLDCAFDEGVLAVRYVLDLSNTTAGAVLMISQTRLSEIPDVVRDCLTPDALEGVLGGGDSGFSPCFYRYAIDVPFDDGYQDRYAVFVAGTHEQTCTALYSPHSVYGFQELSF